jgi:hypothetical protein
MFVLLEHDTTTLHAPAPAGRDVHWDLLIEAPGRELLPTWRLAHNPVTTSGEIPAERLKDHRRLYLDYEGEISGGRGRVRRVDRGLATVERLDADTLVVALEGSVLRGRFEITCETGGQATLRRVPRPCRP